MQGEHRNPRLSLRLDAQKIRILHIIQVKNRTLIRLQRSYLNMAHVNAFHMPEIKTLRWRRAEHIRFRVFVFDFRRVECRLLRSSTSSMLDEDIAHLDVLNRMPRNAAQDG